MARRQHQNSVSLFPFLAVLVCAMGSLILLLLVMTRKIRHDQMAEPDGQAAVVSIAADVAATRQRELVSLEADVNSLQASLRTLRERVQALENEVLQHRNALAAKQAELSGLRAELKTAETAAGADPQGLEQELKTLREQETRLLTELSETERALLEKRDQLARAEDAAKEAEILLYEKSSALVTLRAQVKKAEDAALASTGTETLLEFSNSTGSSRTPIVIDVTARGFEVLPNGVGITMADMESFPVRDNPLLSAILSTHRHRSGRSVTDEPYVLLLVRPGGSLPFYGAQRILTEAGIHYGYELLLPERTVVAGEPDLTEPPVVRVAMQEAFRRRENLYAKLFAITQQERERLGSGTSGETSEDHPQNRKLSIRPDGRVIEETPKARRRLEGRFYAGGVAPPSSFFENRAESHAAGAPRGRMNGADAERLAEEFAERYARQREIAEATEIAGRSPGTSRPDARQPGQKSGDPGVSVATENLPAPVIRSDAEKRFADAMFGGDGTLQGSRLIGRRSDAFSASPASGAGTKVGSATGSASPSATFDQLLSESPSASSTSRPAAGPGSKTTPPGAENTSGLPAIPAVTASKSATSETDAPPWYHSSRPSESPQDAGSRIPGVGKGGRGDAATGSGKGSKDYSQVDRDTMQRLGTAARGGSSLAIPVGIVVFLDDQHVTVAQQPAVRIGDEQKDFVEAELLRGINSELVDARKSPADELMPIVRFVVSPGGEKWRVPLAASLRRSGIHSVTLYDVTPYMLPQDDTGYAHLNTEASEVAP